MILGKRKRDVAVVKRSPQPISVLHGQTSDSQLDAHEVFQHYFESHFEPLADLALPNRSAEEPEREDDQKDDSDGASETSEWNGISDAETTSGAIEVVRHELGTTGLEDPSVDIKEVKTFMVSYF